MLAFYIGLFAESTSYKRKDYDLIVLLAYIGGLFDSLAIIGLLTLGFFTKTHVDLKLIKIFYFPIDHRGGDLERENKPLFIKEGDRLVGRNMDALEYFLF